MKLETDSHLHSNIHQLGIALKLIRQSKNLKIKDVSKAIGGVTTFEWTKNLSPLSLNLQNDKRKKTVQPRI